MRHDALRALHHEQIALLRQWRAAQGRGTDAEAEALLTRLLLTLNGIAGGLSHHRIVARAPGLISGAARRRRR
ncbi:MAG: phosphoenolpyruvate carboxylase [bacterium]